MTVELWPVARFSSGPRIRHARVDAVVMRSREPMLSGDGSSHLLLKGCTMSKQGTLKKLSCNGCPFTYCSSHDEKRGSSGCKCELNRYLKTDQYVGSMTYHPKCLLKDGLIIEFSVLEKDDMLYTKYSYR